MTVFYRLLMKEILIIDKTGHIESALGLTAFSTIELDDEVVGLNTVGEIEPTVILLHHNVMEEQTSYYIKLLLESSRQSNVVVIASALDEREILSCLLAGANGYQNINQLGDYADRLVTAVGKGEAWITRRMTAILIDSLRESSFE